MPQLPIFFQRTKMREREREKKSNFLLREKKGKMKFVKLSWCEIWIVWEAGSPLLSHLKPGIVYLQLSFIVLYLIYTLPGRTQHGQLTFSLPHFGTYNIAHVCHLSNALFCTVNDVMILYKYLCQYGSMGSSAFILIYVFMHIFLYISKSPLYRPTPLSSLLLL